MSNQEGIDTRTHSAYILAAGRGTRMYPFSQLISKPLLPIVNIPIILHSIKRLLLAGINKISVVIKPEEQRIQEILNTVYPDLKFRFIIQKEPLGTGHAVLQIEKYVEHDNFIVLAGDSLFSADYLEKLSKTHLNESNIITLSLEEMNYEQMRKSSTVDYSNGRVWNIREKPQTRAEVLSNLNSAALYIFTPAIFDALKETDKSIRNEYELAPAIMKLINLGKRVGGKIASQVYHISNAYDLWNTNLEFLTSVELEDSNGNLIGKEVENPTPNKVTNSVIGDFCSILDGVKVQNSVVLPNSFVKHDITNSLVLSDHSVSFLGE